MTLKLLTPMEAQGRSKKSLESEKHRLVEVQTLITQKYKELSQAEADFDTALQRNRNQWSAEQQEHQNKLLKLKAEVEELEERKRQALIPLQLEQEKLDTKASALGAREVHLNSREETLSEKEELLERRLDEVAEREIQADTTAKTLAQQAEGVKYQAAQVTTNSTALTVAMARAASESSERERILDLREATIKAKESNVAERERRIDVKETELAAREIRLRDERGTLDRAWKELKNNGGDTRPKQDTSSIGS